MVSHEVGTSLNMETQEVITRTIAESHETSSLTITPNEVEPKADNGVKANEEGVSLSKRAAKKLLKHQKWLENRPFRKAKKKEKLKKRMAEAKLLNLPNTKPSRKLLKSKKMSLSECKVRVVLDFSFDHLMNHKDICKTVKQMNYCYSKNRRATNPLQFHVTSFKGPSKNEIQKYTGYTNWDVNFHTEDYLEIFKKEELLYLTSDSENVIEELDESKVYIIGALVDHNCHKGLSYSIAQKQGIAHARLPIKENLDIKTRVVLAVSHVFEILVNVCSGDSWTEALLKVIPQRKGAVPKEASNNSDFESRDGTQHSPSSSRDQSLDPANGHGETVES